MDEKLIDASEALMKVSLEGLFLVIRSKTASKNDKIRKILDFHFTSQEQLKMFLGDLGMVEDL